MYPKNVRWFLVAVAAALGVLAIPERPTQAAMFLLGAALLAVGHFRYGTVWLAFRAQQHGNTERAKQLLRQIAVPDRLTPQNQAYYHLLVGMHALEAGSHKDSYAALARVDLRRLRSDNDRSLTEALLAAASLNLGERERTKLHLGQARAYAHRSAIGALIDSIDADIARPMAE
jgi:hypothetical protein